MYTLKLSHASNPDIDGGYWPGSNRSPNTTVDVDSMANASLICRQYIEENGLGDGNWTGGQIFQEKEQVAQVSYNGRVWSMDGSEIQVSAAKTVAERQTTHSAIITDWQAQQPTAQLAPTPKSRMMPKM